MNRFDARSPDGTRLAVLVDDVTRTGDRSRCSATPWGHAAAVAVLLLSGMSEPEIEGLRARENPDRSTGIASAWRLPRDAGTPAARIPVVPDHGHMAHETDPILVTDLIRTFVSTEVLA